VSQEEVEIVRGIDPAPEVDCARHFLQWERAGVLNRTLEYLLRDLR
jgi:hypothetical protein